MTNMVSVFSAIDDLGSSQKDIARSLELAGVKGKTNSGICHPIAQYLSHKFKTFAVVMPGEKDGSLDIRWWDHHSDHSKGFTLFLNHRNIHLFAFVSQFNHGGYPQLIMN